MYCENCGAPLTDGAKFCPNCGAAVAQNTTAEVRQPQQPQYASQPQTMSQPQPAARPAPSNAGEPTARIQLCADGKYRWSYEVNLWKNPSILLDLLKAFGIIMVGMWLFITVLIPLFNDDFYWDDFGDGSMVFLWIVLGVLVLCLLGYLLFAAISGGRYAVYFVMDENTVVHRQMPKQVKRAQVIAAINLMMDPMNSGSALLAASGMPYVSHFKKVRTVKAERKRNLIKVNEALTKNRIYVEDSEDYEFVLRYITERCPKARKK